MELNDGEKLNSVEKIKNKLFSRSDKTEIEHRDIFTHRDQRDVPTSWKRENIGQNVEKFFMKTSLFKKFFLFSLVFFGVALLYAAYSFLGGGNTVSNNNIDISVIGNTFTAGGEELPLIIEITNKNNSSLELVDLIVEYPKSSSGDLSEDTERLRQSLGTIPAGGVQNDTVKVVLFGEQGSIRPIKISIEYRVEGSNAIFIKEKIFEVSINSTPVDISIDAPSEISPNQDIALGVKVTLNSTKTFPNMLLRVDYPIGFQFSSAKPAPSFGNNIWNLGDLPPGSVSKISISGKMLDVFDGEEKTFRVWSGSQSSADKSLIKVLFNSKEYTVFIKKPFIGVQLFVNGVYQKEYTTDSNSLIRAEVRYANNLETKVNDLEIRAKISGNAVNRKTINAERGFYNSSADTIIWDKSSINQFKEVNSDES